MTSTKQKVFLCLFSIAFIFSNLFAEDWVLSAKRFEFSQNKKRDVSEDELSTLLPQLVLEQISEGLIRNTSSKEMMDRTLESYLVERQSLFLQLSKDYKNRDSLVLTTDSKKKLDKAIRKQQEKIRETELKIEENLNKTEQIRAEYKKLVESQGDHQEAETDFNLFFNPLTNLFVKKTESLLPDTREEKIVLYKGDPSVLYEPGDSYRRNGLESRVFEKAIVNEKINGLIDGSLTVYGDYFSVTCSLYLYPGREKLGTITEVGKIRNCGTVAANLSSYFCPLITNHLPVEVYFEVSPEEIAGSAHVTVDGIYYEKVPEKLILDAGKHTVKVECKDHYSRMISYEFIGAEKFLVQADMIKETKAELSVAMTKPVEGKIYADGKFAGEVLSDKYFGKFTAGGEPVIGHFTAREKDRSGKKASFFYYVPENLQVNDSMLAVNGKAIDHEAYIEKRRIWTYRAYTLLVLSMPFTLYYTGQYTSAVYAYNNKSMNDLDEVYRLQNAKNACLGVTAVCTGFFIIELIRYLKAANSVLPVNAHKASARELRKAEEWASRMTPPAANAVSEENMTEASDSETKETEIDNNIPGDKE
ncbi:MAG: hypothetical protein Q4B64_05125 [Spirochaetales bacterium]|nr:hypothetical protein [Spirochaetales bacterium]